MRDDDGRLLRTYKDGRAHLNAYLEDHAFLIEALLVLYEADLRPALVRGGAGARRDDDRPLRRRRARRLLLDLGRPRDADRPPQGGRRPPDPGRQQRRRARPAAPRRADRRSALRRLGPSASSPSSASPRSATPTPSPTSCGHWTSTSPRPARWPWSAPTPPPSSPWSARPSAPTSSSPSGPAGATEPPLLDARTEVGGEPAAYVCEGFTCQLPVTDRRPSSVQAIRVPRRRGGGHSLPAPPSRRPADRAPARPRPHRPEPSPVRWAEKRSI